MARAEHDGEGGERQRDVERAVGPPGADRSGGRGSGEHLVAGGHRLQLQRDVGDDADHGDQRDKRGEQRALAVAAGDEVGDRGDAVGPRDPHDLAQHDPGQQHRQRRPEVDRQEPDPGARRPSDAAEVGPGGAEHPPGQRVDGGVVDHRTPLPGAPVAIGRNGEQQQQVAERGAQHQRRGDHRSSSSRASLRAAPALAGERQRRDQAGPDQEERRRQQRQPEDGHGLIPDDQQREVHQREPGRAERDEHLRPRAPAALHSASSR